ncbi:hypothetical protein BGX27_009527 [Mortierella sp. AM989]|nr:hypothetical protein BGX27_009527 [Mortierella sp. AM989]
MSLGLNGILKASLWLQAGSLLVLTSLLANSYAWIGATLTGIGLCFVTVGIGAAHKGSLGYLYCLMDPVLVLGQKIVDDGTHAMRTIVPALYGLQGVAWCTSLLCLVYLRLVAQDPTLGFEIQNPKNKSGVHTVDSQRGMGGSKRNNRISQRFFNMRHSTIGPLEINEMAPTREQKKEIERMAIHSEQQLEQQSNLYKIQEPHVAWTREERRESNDSNTIFIPRGRRISQVVVTFRDDSVHDRPSEQLQRSPPQVHLKSAISNNNDVEVRTVFVDSNKYGLEGMPFEESVESLSDTIFKAVQPLSETISKKTEKSTVAKDTAVRASNESDFTDVESKAELPSLSAVTTLNDHAIPGHECEFSPRDSGAMIGSNIVFPKDKAENIEQYQRQQQQQQQQQQCIKQYKSELENNENTYALTTIKNIPYPIVPERRSSINHESMLGTPTQSSPTNDLNRLYRIGEDEESESDTEDVVHDPYGYSGYPDIIPCMQPNTSGSHRPTNDIVDTKSSTTTNVQCTNNRYPESSFTDHDQDCEQTSPITKPKPSLASLQYWRNRNSGNNNTGEYSSSPTSVALSLVSNFTKKKKQVPVPPTTSKIPALVIPTIVLHPDDEDDEPVRVLSDMDIEYLSTMPPVPLRTLAEQWDEDEGGYYDGDGDGDGDVNDGYDYDGYHHRYAYDYEDDEEDIKEEDEQHQVSISPVVEGEYDPYALDVPINLEIDLQGLEQGDIISAY